MRSAAERIPDPRFPLATRSAGADIGLRDYRRYLAEAGMSKATISVYVPSLVSVEAWCEERGWSLQAVPGRVLADYLPLLPNTRASRRRLYSVLMHYWALSERADPPLGVIRVPRRPRMVCRALEPEEAARLSRHAVELGDSGGLAVLLGLYQALRSGEIASVRWEDFAPDGWLTVMGTDPPARIPLHRHPAKAVQQLVRRATSRDDDPPSGLVFPGRVAGEHGVRTTTVWNWVRQVGADVGLHDLTTTRLRHTCLATALDATGDLRAVRDFARHASVETTQIYTRTTERQMQKVVAAINYDVDDPEPSPP